MCITCIISSIVQTLEAVNWNDTANGMDIANNGKKTLWHMRPV